MEDCGNSKIQKNPKEKTENGQRRSGKAAANKTESSQPNIMEEKLLEIITQNTK